MKLRVKDYVVNANIIIKNKHTNMKVAKNQNLPLFSSKNDIVSI